MHTSTGVYTNYLPSTFRSKGKVKSGGARVITFNILTNIQNGHVILLIYDKEEASTVKMNVIKEMARDMGLDIS